MSLSKYGTTFFLLVVLNYFILVEPRKKPCVLSEILPGIIVKSMKSCGNIKSSSSAHEDLTSSSSKLRIGWNITKTPNQHYVVQIKAKGIRKSKSRRGKGQRPTIFCMQIYIKSHLYQQVQGNSERPLKLSCSKKYLGRKGNIKVVLKRHNTTELIKNFKYKFQVPPRRFKQTTVPTTTKIVHGVTCSSWKPNKIGRRIINGGVNISVCPRDPRFQRMEFGLLNVKFMRMHQTVGMRTPMITPHTCWAFFPNVTAGTYKGTVQLRGCTDCPMFQKTGEVCSTRRYHSLPVSIQWNTTGTTDSSPRIGKIKIEPTTDHNEIIAATCGSFTLVLIIICILYVIITVKKCGKKNGKIRRTNSFKIAGGVIMKPISRTNKIFVVSYSDDKNHVNAVKSFCGLLKMCGNEVILGQSESQYSLEFREIQNIPECTVVIVILSKGLVKKCKNMNSKSITSLDEDDDSFYDESTSGLDCLKNMRVFQQKSVIFVSFGYGLENIPELSKVLAVNLKNVFSITKEPDEPKLPSVHHIGKRSLNLQTLLPFIDVEPSLNMEDIYQSDEVHDFLFHVSKVMDKRIVYKNEERYSINDGSF